MTRDERFTFDHRQIVEGDQHRTVEQFDHRQIVEGDQHCLHTATTTVRVPFNYRIHLTTPYSVPNIQPSLNNPVTGAGSGQPQLASALAAFRGLGLKLLLPRIFEFLLSLIATPPTCPARPGRNGRGS